MLHRWLDSRDDDITTYRDQSYQSVVTGDVAPVPYTPWMENDDDDDMIIRFVQAEKFNAIWKKGY